MSLLAREPIERPAGGPPPRDRAAGAARAAAIGLICATLGAAAPAAELAFRGEEIAAGLGVGYAVLAVDMNDDGRQDVVVVDTDRVIWYQNPAWKLHTLITGQTKRDNVCLAPYDVDGDGRLDFALGADWRPFDTKTGGTIGWLSRGAAPDAPWNVHPIAEEPMMHRMRWVDVDDDGRAELVAVALMGRDTQAPDWNQRGVRILAFQIPPNPRRDPWPVSVLNDELHVTHNFWPTDLEGDARLEILVASFEGVSLLARGSPGGWSRRLLGAGNQHTRPNRGASEIKHGRLAGGGDYLATIEPWHGSQVVVYTPPASGPRGGATELWRRHVLDEQLKWGHAVWCANLDDDPDQELVIGVRDDLADDARRGLRIYDPRQPDQGRWQRHLFDPGGVAVEDLAVADFDADGRPDVVAVGRATHNVRIYWNETK